jgi:hypothetical protein
MLSVMLVCLHVGNSHIDAERRQLNQHPVSASLAERVVEQRWA